MFYYILLPLFIVLAICVHFVLRQRLPLKLQRFKGRDFMSINEIHNKYYPDYKIERFIELWNEIASAVEVPPELIRPTDRFDEVLGPVKGYEIASESDALEEIFLRRAKKQQMDFDKMQVETVDDYIKQFAK